MKKYLDYCKDCHPKSSANVFSEYVDKNIIIYGNNHMNNYVFTLNNLKQFSKSKLKYSRRIVINCNGEDILFNISDIHFEVDFLVNLASTFCEDFPCVNTTYFNIIHNM